MTQKLPTETTTPHLRYSYVVTIAGDYYKFFNGVELHIFKSLKVHLQVARHPCDPFLLNNSTDNSAKKDCFVMLNVKLQVKL